MQIWSHSFQISTYYQLNKRFNLSIGVQYIKNGNHKFKDPLSIIFPFPGDNNELDRYVDITYVNIPLKIEYSILKSGKLKFGLSVFYGVNLGSKTTITYTDGTPEQTIINDVIYKSDFGIKTSLSYRFKIFKKLYLPLTLEYNHGLKDINNPKLNDTEILKTRNWQFGIGLIYNL